MNDLSALETRLRALEDCEAIRRQLATIARATDRFDGALFSTAVDEDAAIYLGGDKPLGLANFLAAFAKPAATPGRMHLIANELVGIDGDRARSESHILSFQNVVVDDVTRTRIRAGRYVDRWVRRESGWKLIHRTMVDEWSRVDAVKEALPAGAHVGKPAPDDLSYDSAGAL